jgi:ABC-type sugar transport system ATPase subunit
MQSENANSIVFEHVGKRYGKTEVIRDFNLTVDGGERVILLGPSGCGKSTLLRMIAGFEEITSGTISMAGRPVNHVPCGERGVAMVFQNYALYPHMTVTQNITYGLRAQHMAKEEMETRLAETLDMLKLTPYAGRLPKELSGGQRQRVALARAVIKRSPFFLLDEPLSNLDAQLRLHARKELVRIHEKYHQTFIYVTHDQIEAMTVGQKIVLLKDGAVQMADTPAMIYSRPANVFTARFIGSPSMNIINADYADGLLRIGGQTVQLPEMWQRVAAGAGTRELCLGIRPEHLVFGSSPADNALEGTVKYEEYYGNRYGVYLNVSGTEMTSLRDGDIPADGEKVFLRLNPEKIHLFRREDGSSIGYPPEIPVAGCPVREE